MSHKKTLDNGNNTGRYIYKENLYMNHIPIGCNFPSWLFTFANYLNVRKTNGNESMAIKIKENNEITFWEEIILECANEGKLQFLVKNLEFPF